MSLAEATGWTLLRSALLALAALPLCHLLAAFLVHQRPVARRIGWALLLVPFLTPELVTGYGYSSFALSLVHHPYWKEVLYAALVGMHVLPVGVAAVYFAPPSPLTAEAIHCRRLALRAACGRLRRAGTMAALDLRGPLRRLVPAFLLVFLLAFQEFEIATLMWATAWTDELMKQQARGTFLSESLRQALLPLACEAVVLVPGVVVLWRSGMLPAVPHASFRPLPRMVGVAAWSYVALAAVAVCVVPFWFVGRTLGVGLTRLWDNPLALKGMLREIAVGGAFAVAAGGAATLLTMTLLRAAGDGRRCALLAAAALALGAGGLMGSLILGLLVLALFQSEWLYPLYDTPVPLLVGLTLFLLPRAMLLHVLLTRVRPRESSHLARLLFEAPDAPRRREARGLRWRLDYRGRVWLTVLACYWAYLDLTLAYLLRPSWVTTAPVELYNLMHFSRNDTLSALTLVTVAVPVLVILLAASLRRPLARILIR